MIAQSLVLSHPRPDPVMNDEDRRRLVREIAEGIDFGSARSILQFGAKVVENASRHTDSMLAQARADDLSETGKTLTEIVLLAQSFDASSLDYPWTRLPVVGSILSSLFRIKDRVISRFDSVKDQIDKLVGSVESTAALLEKRDLDFQAMYESVKAEYGELGLHIEAIELRLADLDRDIGAINPHEFDMDAAERLGRLDAARKTLVKRADDLRVMHHSLMQMMPMVRILQTNNLAIIDKFTTIRTLTLPTWKRTFLLALSLNEQRDAVGLADTIDQATNAMLKRNAQLLRENSIAVAQSNQRLVIDVDTLKSVHETVLATLREVRQIHADGEAARAGTLQELAQLRSQMIEGLTAADAASV